MLFFKPKPKNDEILPPMAPDGELEQATKEKPKFFDEVISAKKVKPQNFPEENEFKKFMDELDTSLETKPILKKEKPVKKTGMVKRRNFLKTKSSKLKKTVKAAKAKGKKIQPKKQKSGKVAKPLDSGQELGIDNFDLNELLRPKNKEIAFPKELEDLDIGQATNPSEKPKEILEAEREIKGAIDKIKESEKPSFFKRLFARKKETKEAAKTSDSQDKVSSVHKKIDEARQALAKLDIESSKKLYIEVMKIYKTMTAEEQAKVYNDIRDIYFERKNAEELEF